MRRMDRYKDETPDRPNRYEKNQELYQDIASNTKYTNITDVTNSNAFEINGFKNKGSYTSRESYQQMKKYKNVESVPRIKKELDDFNYLYKIDDKKVYDINIVLEEARKNRQEKDKLEEKRKLKNTSYNILADLNIEELEKYKAEKIKKIMTPEEEEFRDLIDTIASKTLAGEIDKETSVNLLSDLMATSVMDKVEDANSLGYDNESYEDKESNKEETSTQVEEAMRESINKIIDIVKQTLEQTPPELASDIMEKGIVLAGGGALIKNFDKLLSIRTEMPVYVTEDPLECVVKGTGKTIEDLERLKSVLINSRRKR